MNVVVLGFGPFLDVSDNPAARLARAVNGCGERVQIVGAEMPVSYRRARVRCVEMMTLYRPHLLLGVGVARGRTAAMVERTAFAETTREDPDVDGDFGEMEGPPSLMSVGAESVAAALRLPLSDDAGRYVCNGWLYRALLDRFPAVFLHIPPAGFAPDTLIEGIERWAAFMKEEPAVESAG